MPPSPLRLSVGALLTAALLCCTCSDGGPGEELKVGDGSIAADGKVERGALTADLDLAAAALIWRTIPAGEFRMGCSPGDLSCRESEGPPHVVQVRSFQLTATEVTQAQYMAVTGSNPSTLGDCPACPVDGVAWDRAREFCEGAGGRLPSEAEWELAARGGTVGPYPCGEDSACLDEIAWYLDNAGGRPHPAGQKHANLYELYDTLGNLWEWVADCWHDDFEGAPADGRAWDAGDCTYRVQRGGSWGLSAAGLRVSNRDADYPDGRYYLPSPGFRCARDPS